MYYKCIYIGIYIIRNSINKVKKYFSLFQTFFCPLRLICEPKVLYYIMMRTRIVILGLIWLLLLGSISSAKKQDETNPWQDLFTDYFEKVYIIMKDEMIIRYTSQNEIMIDMSIGRLKKELKKIDYSIKDIAIVIHNHRISKNFTRSDYKQYWTFKNYGFDGQFLLYCHRTNKTYDIEDEIN